MIFVSSTFRSKGSGAPGNAITSRPARPVTSRLRTTAAIEQISSNIGNLTAQQTAAHAKAMATFYQTLTPEQQTKFTQMVHEGHSMGMEMHRHGGMGGPPPGASFE